MNTKGIKFLAVLAVLAMAFAAFAIIAPAEENDATQSAAITVNPTDNTATLTVDSTAAATTYYFIKEANAGKTVELTVNILTGKTADIRVSDGTTVQVVKGSDTTNTGGTVKLSTTTSAVAGDIDSVANTFVSFVATANTDGNNVITYTADDEAPLIYGTTSVALTFDASSLVTVKAEKTLSASIADALANVKSVVKVNGTATSIAYGSAVATISVSNTDASNPGALELKAITHATPAKDGIVKITQSAAGKMLIVGSAGYTGTITVVSGSVSTNGLLADNAGTIKLNGAFLLASTDTSGNNVAYPTGVNLSTIKFLYGNVSATIEQTAVADITLVNVTGTVVAKQDLADGGDEGDATTPRSVTINAKAASMVITDGEDDVETFTSGTIDVKSGFVRIANASGATVNIMENAEIISTNGTAMAGGMLNIYGKMSGTAKAGNDKMTLGPTFYGVAPITNDVLNSIYGQDKTASGVYDDDATLKNVILTNDVTIDNGATVTIDGYVGLNNCDIIVKNGTLQVTSNGFLFAGFDADAGKNSVEIQDKGKIVNDGIVGANLAVKIKVGTTSATQKGITGVSYTYGTIGTAKTPILKVSGNAVAVSDKWKPDVATLVTTGVSTDVPVQVVGELIIGADVTFTPTNTTVISKAVLTTNGVLNPVSLVMKNGSTVSVKGQLDGTITMEVREAIPAEDLSKTTTFNTTTVNGAIDAASSVSGFTLYVKQTSYVDDEDNMFYNQRAYVNGKLVGTNDALITPTDKFTIGGADNVVADNGSGKQLYIAADEKLDITTGLLWCAVDNGATIIVDGQLVAPGGYNGKVDPVNNRVIITGVYYKVTVDAKTTHYFTNFDAAFDAIANADDKKIDLQGGVEVELTKDVVVADAYQIAATDGTIAIPEEYVMTVESGGKVANGAIGKIYGVLTVKNGATCTPEETMYDVMSTDADKNKMYSGLQKALENATGEVTITLSTDKTSAADALKTLSLKEGTTLNVAANLKVTKALSIANGAKMVVTDSGSLILGDGAEKSRKLTVDGELDLSAVTTSSINGTSADDKIIVNVTGALKYNNNVSFTNATINAVSCTIDDVKTYTTVEKAVEGKAKSMEIVGKYTDTSLEMTSPSTLTIAAGAEMYVKSIDASAGATITVNGKLSATVTGVAGTDKTASAISLDEFQGKIAQSSKTISTGETEYTFAITQMDAGSASIDAGSVKLACSPTVAANEFLYVSSEAELVSAAENTITNSGNFTVAGILTIAKDGDLTIDNTDAKSYFYVTGIVDVDKEGELTFNTANVSGIIGVDGKLTITGNTVVVGGIIIDDSDESVADVRIAGGITLGTSALGDGAYITGKFTLTAPAAFIKVFPGTEIDEDSIKDLKYTEIYLNDVAYCVAFGTAASTVKIYGADGVITSVVKINGYDMTGMSNEEKWMDEDGNYLPDGDFPVIGAHYELYFNGVAGTAKVKVSTVTGVSIFVDGVKYASGATINDVEVGTHTVTATIDPGYKGTTAITFDGKSVTSSFEITKDMVGANAATKILSVTGNISIDTGDAPEPTPTEKSEWTITTILLVVLIILIAVMVIILILRMNRS